MPRSLVVRIEPRVLKWLRESSGWKIEEVSEKLNTTPEAVTELESGKKRPTLRQLKDLSSSFKRPLSSFLLSEPKKEKPLPKDYRFLPNKQDVFDKKTILAIRRSRSLQKLGMDLSSNIGSETGPKIKAASQNSDPGAVASQYRELFGLTREMQEGFRDAYMLFNYLRDALEDANIMVFQFSMPVEDARGFALVDESPAVIVVNSQDSIEARLFTLMHEFGHILLGETVIDMPRESPAVRDHIEKWCNAFSSSFLLPAQVAKDLFGEKRKQLTETETLSALSKKCKVSKAVLLYKMLDLRYISRSQFDDALGRRGHAKEAEKNRSKNKKTIISPDQRCLSQVGSKFVSLVADNFDRRLITYADALNYLSIKSRNFEKVLAKARK